MVREAVRHGDGEGRVGQAFDYVAILEVILAIAVRREPPRSHVMYSVAGDEWIIERLREFVTGRSDVSERRSEDAGTDPARIVHHIPLLHKLVLVTRWFKVIAVEAKYAASE